MFVEKYHQSDDTKRNEYGKMCDLNQEGVYETVLDKFQIGITLESAKDLWEDYTLKFIFNVELQVKMMCARFMFLRIRSSCGLKGIQESLSASKSN